MELREGYKRTEIGIIPEDWGVKSLGDIGSFKNGINKSKEDFGFGYPFVNLMDVFGKPKICGDEEFGLINSNDAERNLYNLKYNDLLFIRSSVKPSGVGLTSVISKDLKETVFSGFLIRFRDNGKLDVEYKKHCFYEERFRIQLISNSSVSANTNINQDALKSLNIPLPPLPEQKAIAEVLSDTDELIQTMEKQIAKKRLIKQGAMQKLLTPKADWEVKKLGEIGEISKGEQLNRDTLQVNDIYPVINGGIVPSGHTNIWNRKSDTITISEGGNSCGFVNFIKTKFWQGGHCYAIETKKHQMYLYHFLKFSEKTIMNLRVGSGLPNIQRNRLSVFEISLPKTKTEQSRISTILSDMDSEIEMLENKLSKYKKIKQGLMQELLTGKTRLV